jgi:hypothetical protein
MRFVVEYGPWAEREGREPLIDEYAEYLGLSRAQAFRRQAAFRECSPNQDVMSVWNAVKGELLRSNFKCDGSRKQAVFCLSLVPTWSVPE